MAIDHIVPNVEEIRIEYWFALLIEIPISGFNIDLVTGAKIADADEKDRHQCDHSNSAEAILENVLKDAVPKIGHHWNMVTLKVSVSRWLVQELVSSTAPPDPSAEGRFRQLKSNNAFDLSQFGVFLWCRSFGDALLVQEFQLEVGYVADIFLDRTCNYYVVASSAGPNSWMKKHPDIVCEKGLRVCRRKATW